MQMKYGSALSRLVILAGQMLTAVASFAVTTAYSATCTPIGHTGEGIQIEKGVQPAFLVKAPGQYCLTEDIRARRIFIYTEGGERSGHGSLARITGSNIAIDLQGHTLLADASGTWGIEARRSADLFATDLYAVNIVIHNGVIKSRTNSGVNLDDLFRTQLDAMIMEYFAGRLELRNYSGFNQAIFAEDLKWLKSPSRRDVFPKTGHHVYDLEVEADNGAGITIKGASNTIENTKIYVNGVPGVLNWGPDQIIQNNVIRIKMDQTSRPQGAILLRLGDRSIIRNNTITVEGSDDANLPAIGLIDSRNVLIENNKIIGTKVLYKILDDGLGQQSSVVERGNTFSTLWQRMWGR